MLNNIQSWFLPTWYFLQIKTLYTFKQRSCNESWNWRSKIGNSWAFWLCQEKSKTLFGRERSLCETDGISEEKIRGQESPIERTDDERKRKSLLTNLEGRKRRTKKSWIPFQLFLQDVIDFARKHTFNTRAQILGHQYNYLLSCTLAFVVVLSCENIVQGR